MAEQPNSDRRPRPSEQIETGRRNLIAQLRHELRRDLDEYPIDVATIRDLLEVLEGLAPEQRN